MKYYLTQAGREFIEEATLKQKIGAGLLGGAALFTGMRGSSTTATEKTPTVMQQADKTSQNVDSINKDLAGIRKAVTPYTQASKIALKRAQDRRK